MNLGSRVKIKQDRHHLFSNSDFLKLTGIVLRGISEAYLHHPIIAPHEITDHTKAIFLVRWEASKNYHSDTYIVSENLEFIEDPPIEWLVTHVDEEIREIGQKKLIASP